MRLNKENSLPCYQSGAVTMYTLTADEVSEPLQYGTGKNQDPSWGD